MRPGSLRQETDTDTLARKLKRMQKQIESAAPGSVIPVEPDVLDAFNKRLMLLETHPLVAVDSMGFSEVQAQVDRLESELRGLKISLGHLKTKVEKLSG